MTEKVHCFASRLAFCFFLILFFAAKICALLFTNMALPILVMLLSICALLYTLNRKYGFLQRVSSWITVVVAQVRPASAFAILLALHLAVRLLSIFIFQVDTTTGWDQQAYIPGSTELLEKGYLEQHGAYLYQAPHFFWFAHFLMLPISLFGESNIGILIYLSLISTATSYFFGATLYRQINQATAYAFMLVYALLPSSILICSHITHEHALLFFLSLFAWLHWYLKPQLSTHAFFKHTIEILAYGALLIGSMMNGAGFIAIVAAIIMIAIDSNKTILARAMTICFFALFFFGVRQAEDIYHRQHTRCDVFPSQLEQYKWVLYIGSSHATSGHYLHREHTYFFHSAPKDANQEEIAKHHNNLLKKQYQDLLGHPRKLFELFTRKLKVIWGVFGTSYVNMHEYSVLTNLHTAAAQSTTKFFMYVEAMIALLVAIIVALCKKHQENSFYEWCTLFLCGATCLLLITEVSGKYTYTLQPFLYIFLLVPLLNRKKTEQLADTTADSGSSE